MDAKGNLKSRNIKGEGGHWVAPTLTEYFPAKTKWSSRPYRWRTAAPHSRPPTCCELPHVTLPDQGSLCKAAC